MPYLLDTHVLLWLTEEPENLSVIAKDIIDSDNILFLSYASIWEISIKLRSGKLSIKFPLDHFINTAIGKHELKLLPVALLHIYQTQLLPLHHRDPFDRLIIAQSLSENIPVITSDSIFKAYDIECVW